MDWKNFIVLKLLIPDARINMSHIWMTIDDYLSCQQGIHVLSDTFIKTNVNHNIANHVMYMLLPISAVIGPDSHTPLLGININLSWM